MSLFWSGKIFHPNTLFVGAYFSAPWFILVPRSFEISNPLETRLIIRLDISIICILLVCRLSDIFPPIVVPYTVHVIYFFIRPFPCHIEPRCHVAEEHRSVHHELDVSLRGQSSDLGPRLDWASIYQIGENPGLRIVAENFAQACVCDTEFGSHGVEFPSASGQMGERRWLRPRLSLS